MEGRIFGSLRRLETIRSSHGVFDGKAEVRLLDTGESVLGIERRYEGERLAAFFNFSDAPQTVWTGAEAYTDLWDGAERSDAEVTLLPGDFRWLLFPANR